MAKKTVETVPEETTPEKSEHSHEEKPDLFERFFSGDGVEMTAERTIRSIFTKDQLTELQKDLPDNLKKTRTQFGRNFTYIEAHHIINQANRIFGFGNWTYQVKDIKIIGEGTDNITVFATVETNVYYGEDRFRDFISITDVGVSQGKPSMYEMMIKGAVTDGMKRALRAYGNQFGNSLYEKDEVVQDENGHHQTNVPSNYRPPQNQPSGNVTALSTVCVECGEEIGDYIDPRGYKHTAQKRAGKMMEQFGKVYCGRHKPKHNN